MLVCVGSLLVIDRAPGSGEWLFPHSFADCFCGGKGDREKSFDSGYGVGWKRLRRGESFVGQGEGEAGGENAAQVGSEVRSSGYRSPRAGS